MEGRQEVYEKSVYLLLNFAVNLKLLKKKSILKDADGLVEFILER